MKNQWIKTGTQIASIFALAGGLMGCAHASHIRGSVALKHSAQEADVCLGSTEVKVGDKVALYKNECKQKGARKGTDVPSCTKVKVGEGEVTNVLDEHYSTIRVNGATPDAGLIVEKM